MDRRIRHGGVGRRRDHHQHVHLDRAQPLGQQFGGVQIGDPQHDDGVADVADDLGGAVAVAEAGGDVGQRLGVDRKAQARAASLVQGLHDFRAAHQLRELVQMQAGFRSLFHHRQALAQTVLVEFAGVGHQIAHHALPHRGGDFRVGQGVEAAVDHRPLADRRFPIQDRARVVGVGVVRVEQLAGASGQELLQQRLHRDRNLVEKALFVLEGPPQPVGHRIVQFPGLVEPHQLKRARVAGFQVARDVGLDAGSIPIQQRPPAGRTLAVEPVLEVADQQRLDVVHVLEDFPVIRPLPQRVQGAGDDVGEQPGELAKRFRVALGGQLVGDPGGDFGDPREAPDRVVAGGMRGVAQMEAVKRPPGARRLGVQAPEHVGIALGVQANHRMAPADVLDDGEFQRAGFTHAGRPHIKHMALALDPRQINRLLPFQQADAMQGGQPADRRSMTRSAGQARPGLGRFDEAAIGGARRIPEPLGVPCGP